MQASTGEESADKKDKDERGEHREWKPAPRRGRQGRRRDGSGENGAARNVGRIEEIQGVVIEAVFPDRLPEINHAITVERPPANKQGEGEDVTASSSDLLVCEVQQHLGDDRVRAVAMDTTDGLARGVEVIDTGGPITVPVGDITLGRIFNLLGEPIDLGEELPDDVERRGSTRRPRASRTSPRRPRCSRPASRSSTCWRPTPRAARSACSAAPAWARPC